MARANQCYFNGNVISVDNALEIRDATTAVKRKLLGFECVVFRGQYIQLTSLLPLLWLAHGTNGASYSIWHPPPRYPARQSPPADLLLWWRLSGIPLSYGRMVRKMWGADLGVVPYAQSCTSDSRTLYRRGPCPRHWRSAPSLHPQGGVPGTPYLIQVKISKVSRMALV